MKDSPYLVYAPVGRLVPLTELAARGGVRPQGDDLTTHEGAAVVVEQATQKIVWVGRERDLPASYADLWRNDRWSDSLWLPGLVECHTHFLFAGSRSVDFARRAEGMTYLDCAKAGGGILSTVRATRVASEPELYHLGSERLQRFARRGVGVVEGKTGYGLNWASERRCLEAMRALAEDPALPRVVATFLPAHAVPPEFAEKKDEYVKTLCTEWIPEVGREKLAAFVDIFVEEGYFSLDDLRAVALAAKTAQLRLKVHADQFHDSGAASVAAELGATSVDHVDHTSDAGIDALAKAGVVAVLLPGASLYAGHSFPRARRLIDAGVSVALSTDFNPGTSPTTNLPLMATLGCTQLKMTVAESIGGITVSAARALGLEKTHGSLAVGKQFVASSFPVSRIEDLPAAFGEIEGEVVF